MIHYTAAYTDLYQLTMAQVYFRHSGVDKPAVFDYFFRKLPFKGGYAIFAGLEELLDKLETLRFTEEELEFLASKNFDADFLAYLKTFRFRGTIHASQEGDIIFPYRPVLSVEANIIEAQLIETLLLNMLNFQTLIATKSRRIRSVAGERSLAEFGLRRAQGPAGLYASRSSAIGGFDSTSDVLAGLKYGIEVSGTMAHAFIQSYDDELSAFRAYAEQYPQSTILLVDTYDTLNSGIPNAIKIAKELKERGGKLIGIRLDSGDLAYLSKKARVMLDNAGLQEVKIACSNQLDEHVIKSLLEQHAPIDIFGIGTSLVTGNPDASLDGVYKLSFAHGKPRIKISENIEKTTWPHKKQVYRVMTQDSWIGMDVVTLFEEKEVKMAYDPFDPYRLMDISSHDKEPLLQKVMEHGVRCTEERKLAEIVAFSDMRFKTLPDEYKRFANPHIYKVSLSEKLKHERERLIHENKFSK